MAHKIHPTMSAQMVAFLDDLVRIGAYGNTVTEVARYLIQRGIDDLLREGVLTRPDPKDAAD